MGAFRMRVKTNLFITNTQLHRMLIVDQSWGGLLVMFLSAVWTLILMAPIHCRRSVGEQVMQC